MQLTERRTPFDVVWHLDTPGCPCTLRFKVEQVGIEGEQETIIATTYDSIDIDVGTQLNILQALTTNLAAVTE